LIWLYYRNNFNYNTMHSIIKIWQQTSWWKNNASFYNWLAI
jgi:hypothetical protein